MRKWLAALLTLCLLLPAVAFAAGDPRPYRKEDLQCARDGLNIVGGIYRPKNAEENVPLVICAHGFGGYNQAMQPYATALVKQGYAAIVFDFNGGGRSCRSDGATTDMSIFTEEADLKAVLKTAAAFPWVDKNRIYLLGCSQGGMVSAMVAADMPELVNALVLIYPAFSVADDARKRYASAEEIPETETLMGLEIGRVYSESLLDYDPFADVTRYTGDVLIFHGTMDQTVDISWSQKAAEAYPCAELIVYEGEGHGFGGEKQNACISTILEFLNAHE